MTTRDSRNDLFIVDGLIEPEPTPEMARLLAVLGKFECNPQTVGNKQRQLWALHRALHGESWVAINLIAEHDAEDRRRQHLPLPREVERLAQTSWNAWADLVHLGMDTDDMGEPELPEPRSKQSGCRRRRRIIPNTDD